MTKMNFKQLVINVSTRKGMYLYNSSYSGLVNFFMGYFWGVELETSIDVSGRFQTWLKKSEGKEFAMNWSGYILSIMAKDDEEKASELLIELLLEFIESKEYSE